MTVLKENKDKFGINFDENKKTLNGLTIIRSKSLRNQIAGYITRFLKNELIESEKAENMKKQELEDQNELTEPITETVSTETVSTETATAETS